MDEPVNKVLIEKWKNADALYATPTGSNDDWYWLYAAIKFKCLIVTNDEMRDHTFQLLGNDFFPKWKERHQVHFSFSDAGPVFHMPPPCSIVIQESEEGHWHIPVVSEHDYHGERTWLCITRANSHMARQDSATRPEDLLFHHTEHQIKPPPPPPPPNNDKHENTKKPPQEIYKNLRDILSASVFSSYGTVVSDIEAAEKLEIRKEEEEEEEKEEEEKMQNSNTFLRQYLEAESEDDLRFDKSLKELKDLRSQLHYAADYCERTFSNAKQRKMVLENTKEYISNAVVTVVDHLGSISANLDFQLTKNNTVSEAELRINSLKQRLFTCEQYAQKLTLSRLRLRENLPRYHPRYISTRT
ncbi:hypothetical protein L1049_001194 [Liquidambar formosana]|uniref:PRORP domain-containing protein n=1 Tax=Liquidambar formosana TaxID=63359 RepID=A0AAP0NCE6_LIQFO